mgnify:CR=1 FL=1
MDRNEILHFEDVIFKMATNKALFVEIDGIDVWLPKLQITFENMEEASDIGEVSMPRWLAEAKGLRGDVNR